MNIDIQKLDWLSRKLFAGGAFAPEVTNEDTAFCVLLAGAVRVLWRAVA